MNTAVVTTLTRSEERMFPTDEAEQVALGLRV